jgi:hypothetical protein
MSSVFENALEHFDNHEWYNGRELATSNSTCLWLSVKDAAPGRAEMWPLKTLCEILDIPMSFHEVFNWNDSQTDREKVREVLLKAIEIEKQREGV